jgi:alpha-glucosidase
MRTVNTLLFLLMLPIVLRSQPVVALSPDSSLRFSLTVDSVEGKHGAISYDLTCKGRNVILKSRLGLLMVDVPHWIDGFTLIGTTYRHVDTVWHPVYGERNTVKDRYNECTLDLMHDGDSTRRLQIIVRLYNEGTALCYRFPEQLSTSIINIKDERTEFTFEEGAIAYVTPFAQERYQAVPLHDWTYGPMLPLPKYAASTPEYESERPLTLKLTNGLYVSLAEARLVDYARMKFVLSRERKSTIAARLFGPVTESSPFQSPWRIIMVAESPGQLLEGSDIFLNLNSPCEIQDPGWIRPGKIMREVTLSTAGAKECVDFCAKHNIEYIEFDAGWYGYEYSKSADASRVDVDPRRNPRKDLDLPAVIQYAKQRGVGVFLYVNHRALEKQIDEIFPLYEKWGIAGVKFGFVHVGSDRWTSWVHEAVRNAAKHHLMVDIHDEYRPTGFSRTYPNLLTQEGVQGNECMPDADHNTTLPFTRFLAGAADYTICYYHQKGIKNVNGIKTTSAHQLALSVIFYSPLQFVFWYDKPSDYQGEAEVEFFEHIPTVWDTTCVLVGEIGTAVAVARKSGESWFIGGITNNSGRNMAFPLSFLEKGKEYLASVYTDGGGSVASRTHVSIQRIPVTSASLISRELLPSGGIALEIVPVRRKQGH